MHSWGASASTSHTPHRVSTTLVPCTARLRRLTAFAALRPHAGCATGESWNAIMHDVMRDDLPGCEEAGDCGSLVAVPFFVSYVILTYFVVRTASSEWLAVCCCCWWWWWRRT